jgi:hypothetical protein
MTDSLLTLITKYEEYKKWARQQPMEYDEEPSYSFQHFMYWLAQQKED